MVEGTTQKWGKLWIGIGVALVVGLLIGVGIMALTNPAPSPEKTFTVVAYHWGFAIYDEDGTEIPKIEVARGTVVTLDVIGAEALSHELHEAFMERTIEAWADNPEYGDKNATEIMEFLEQAEDAGLMDHSLDIVDYDIHVVTDSESPAPQRVTFVADMSGTFDILCTQFCGWGHQYMSLVGGFVVS